MKKPIVALITLMGIAAAAPARAQQTAGVVDEAGFDLGIRVGYAIPFGGIDGNPGDGLASRFSGGIPFVLEGGYRVGAAVTIGALFQYATMLVKDNALGCGNGGNCSGSTVRLGVEGLYHIVLPSQLIPWVGAGFGYEWMNVDVSYGGMTGSGGARGYELLTLQGGGEFRFAPQFVLGPFVSFSFARYATVTTDAGGTSTSRDIANPAMHEWLQIGVRGAFNL